MRRVYAAVLSVTVAIGILVVPAAASAITWETSAHAHAAASGEPVEIVERRTENEQFFALPDGTTRYDAHVRPQWTRRDDGGWRRIDVDLARREDGMWAPKASTVDVAVSAGGKDQPLVVVEHRGVTARLWWPRRGRPLPAPVVAGNTARYPKVWPGVDLVLRATRTGYTQTLVVTSAKAAKRKQLRRIRLRVGVTGGSLQVNGLGGLTLVDASGKAVAEGAGPQMWDSAGADVWPGDRVAQPGMGDRSAEVALTRSADELVVEPDTALLDHPDTMFPIYIDPPMSRLAGLGRWMYLTSKNNKSVNYWGSKGVGRCGVAGGYACTTGDAYTARQYFQFDTDGWKYKQVIDARFRVFHTASFACWVTITQLKHVGPFDGNSNWGGIIDGDLLGERNTRNGSPTHCDNEKEPPGWVEFHSTALKNKAQVASEGGWGYLRLGLRAKDESNAYTWKLFRNDAKLQIIYNTVPHKPTDLGGADPPMRCVTGSGRPFIGSDVPVLAATMGDSDRGQMLTAAFNVHRLGGDSSGTVPAGPKAGGSQFKAAVPRGWLWHGESYRWRARSHDGFANSAYSDWCEFSVDLERPKVAPQVSSSDYPPGGVSGGSGVTGTFTLRAGAVDDPSFGNDVARYEWGLNTEPPDNSVTPQVLGGNATISVTPDRPGPHTLYVRSVDRAGNRSDLTRYTFRVGTGTPAPIAEDTFGRTVSTGWGEADRGGAWSVIGNAANLSVDGQAGQITMPGPGRGPQAYLGEVPAAADSDVTVRVTPEELTSGNGVFFSLVGRRIDGAGDYRAMLRLAPSGRVWLRISSVDAQGQETEIVAEEWVDQLTYEAGATLNLRLLTTGTSTTTFKAKVWPDDKTEPAWQLTGTDATAELQQPGGIGIVTYLSATADDRPFTVAVDDLMATPPSDAT